MNGFYIWGAERGAKRGLAFAAGGDFYENHRARCKISVKRAVILRAAIDIRKNFVYNIS